MMAQLLPVSREPGAGRQDTASTAEPGGVSGSDLRTAVLRALREVEALKVENEQLRQSLGGATEHTADAIDLGALPAVEAEMVAGTAGLPYAHQDDHIQQLPRMRATANAHASTRQRFCTAGGCHSPALSPHPRTSTSTSGVPRFSRLSSNTGGAGSPSPSARCLSSGCHTSFGGGCHTLSELPELLVEVAAAEAAAAAGAGASGSLAAFRRSTFRRRSGAAGTSSGGGSVSSRSGSRRNSSRRIPLPPFMDGLASHTAAQWQQVLYEVASPFSSYAAAAAVDETDDEAGGGDGAASPTPSHDAVAAAAAAAAAPTTEAGMARRLTMGSRRWLMGASSGALAAGAAAGGTRAPSATSAGMHLRPLSRTASAVDMLAVAAPVFAAYSCVDSELVGPEEGPAAAGTPAGTGRCGSSTAGGVGSSLLEGDEACASPYGSEAEEGEEDEEEAYGWLYSSEDEEETWSSRTSRAAAAGKKGGAKADRSSASGGGSDGRSGWFARWLGVMGVGLPAPATKGLTRVFDSDASPALPEEPPSTPVTSEAHPADCLGGSGGSAADAGAIAFVEMLSCHGAGGQRMVRPPSSSSRLCLEGGRHGQAAGALGPEALEGDSSRSLARSRFSWRR